MEIQIPLILKEKYVRKTVINKKIGDHWSGKTRNKLSWDVFCGDSEAVLSTLQDDFYNCVITSPPYYSLRDYQVKGQIGQEETVQEYVEAMLKVMRQVYRTLAPEGLLFLNLGDTY